MPKPGQHGCPEIALPEQGRKTVAKLFARRHESPFMREVARGAIRDAKLWLRIFGGRT